MFQEILRRSGSYNHDALWAPTPKADRAKHAGELYDLIANAGHDPAVWLAICGKEHSFGTNTNSVLHRNNTRSWTNARSIRHRGIPAYLITDSFRDGNYVKYGSVRDSILDGLYRVDEPGFAYRNANAVSILDHIQLWAPGSDGNRPVEYAQTMCNWVNEWIAEDARNGAPPLPLTDPTERLISMLRQRGHEVHDVRTTLPRNNRHPYSRISMSHVKYIIHHWTGSARAVNTGKQIYAEDMSVQEEIDTLKWYANYHIGLDGGTWGGIAYGVLVFPSGRIYVAHDIGTKTYHAFKANDISYATCCPNANGQAPTIRQLRSLDDVWDILCNKTPEIPATRATILGHSEAKVLDIRNQTTCPGTFLQHVRDFRNNAVQLEPVVSPNERFFPETGKKIVWGFKGYFEKLESFDLFHVLGYPVTDEFRTRVDGVERTVQIFERGALGWYPEAKGTSHEFRHLTRGELWTAVDDARKQKVLL